MKKAKLWVELIFIFALPVIFMVLCFNFKTVNTYDSNNNLLTSEKVLEVNNVSFLRDYNDNIQYINYLKYNQYMNNGNFINTDNWAHTYYNFSVNDNIGTFTAQYVNSRAVYIGNITLINNHKYYINTDALASVDRSDCRIMLFDNESHYAYLQTNLIINNSYNSYDRIFTSNYTTNYYYYFYVSENGGVSPNDYFCLKNIFIIDLTEMFGSGYEPSTISDLSTYIDLENYYNHTGNSVISYKSNNIVSSDYKLNYTWYSAIFYNLFESLQLEYNVLLQIIITYTILWFLMFIIWHLLYCTFDFFVHFGRRRD